MRLLYSDEAADLVGVAVSTVRTWVHRGLLVAFCTDESGRPMYLDRHVYEAERTTSGVSLDKDRRVVQRDDS